MLDQAENTKAEKPPRDGLFRAVMPGVEFRDSKVDGSLGMLEGYFSVFNEWTEIDSIFEGHFLERVAPGAYTKTFAEQRDQMRVLFQHGFDPIAGDKPLGPIELLEQDERGAKYGVPLLDTSYNRDLLPGLKAGLYGASFRFRVVREEFDREPETSDSNPEGLPERTIKEAQVMEFGPVTFPAYAGATAGVRSLTDRFLTRRLVGLDRQAYASDDVSCVAQMVVLSAEFIEAEDDADDIAEMKSIQQSLTGLLDKEATEPDDEAQDAASGDEAASQAPRATPEPGSTSATGANHLYGLRPEKERPSWLL